MHHSIDRIRVHRSINSILRYLVSFSRYSDLFVEIRESFILYLHLAPPPHGVTRQNVAKMFDVQKTRMIGLQFR